MEQISKRDQWSTPTWPADVIPVPLDKSAMPIDTLLFTRYKGSERHFFFIAPKTAIIRPDLIRFLRPTLSERPDVGIFYGDDAILGADGKGATVYCKPAFNEALLLADDYIGFPLLVRASVLEKVQPIFEWRNRNAAWYRFCLGALNAGISIDRIPHTLLASPGPRPKADSRGRASALRDHFAHTDRSLRTARGLVTDTLETKRAFIAYPPVTLVISTRQTRRESATRAPSSPHIVALLDSLRRSTYPLDKITVLIGDDEPDDTAYRGRRDAFSIRRIDTARPPGTPFNYAAKMNRLWRAAETEAIVLMNDDVVVRSPGWLEALLTFSLDPGVGGVGARLIFPTGRVQHAGMFGGIFGVMAHPWYDRPEAESTYNGWALTQRDCSVVTGAVFATRIAAMQAVDGFDESFSLDFNDVDLCLKMRMLGYRIVYTPFAELIHHERASRKENLAPGDQVARFLRRWRTAIQNDPAYSPQLRIDTDQVAPNDAATHWIDALYK